MGVPAVSAAVPVAGAARPLTWVELRCTSCWSRADVILEECLVFGFPPCRLTRGMPPIACPGAMEVVGQVRRPAAMARTTEAAP